MEEIFACRVCLVTNVKLLNIHHCNLSESLQSITGFALLSEDGMPQYLCVYCAAAVRKCSKLREKFFQSQSILNVMLERQLMTNQHINSIDRKARNLAGSLTIENVQMINILHCDDEIKEEPASADGIELQRSIKDDAEVKSEDLDPDFNGDDYHTIENFDSADEQPIIALKFKKGTPKKTAKKKKFVDVRDIQRKDEDSNIETVVLSEKEQLDDIQARKETTNYLSALYKCGECFKGFLQEGTYKNHMEQHDPSNGPHLCNICKIYCVNSRRLRAHKKVAHERRFICRLCNFVATTRHYAREHQRWHKGVTYDCKKCDQSFRKSTSYLTHLRLQHPSEHVCDICGDSFIGKGGLNTHKLKAHRHVDKKSEESSPNYCVECEIKFKSVEALSRHVDTSSIHTNTGAMCKHCLTCGDSFETDDALFDHKKMHRSQIEKIKCKECGLVCVLTNYSAHYRKFHLPAAGGGVGGGGGGEGKKRDIIKNYVCEICGKKCPSNATLSYHQRSHTGEKPYVCPVCPKKFKVHQLMKIHYRTHTGESPYMCTVCAKAFKHKAALNRHVRVHTGVKPYTCPYCGKSFSQSNSLKLHVNTVHLKLPPPYKRRAKVIE